MFPSDENQVWWAQTSVQAGDTVNSTNAEVIFASKPQVFPANSFNPGDVIRFTARGLFGAGGIIPAAFTFHLKLGSVAICTSAAISTALGLSNKPWELKGEASFTSIGASASVECGGSAMLSTGTGVQAVELMPVGGVTVDSTAAIQLQLSVQPSISLSSNTITLRQFLIEKLRT